MPRLGKTVFIGAVSSSLLALAFPRFGFSLAAWFALAPLLLDWQSRRPLGAFISGWWSGFIFHGVALYWIYPTCRFAGLSGAVGLLAWSALALSLGVQWGIIAFLGSWLINSQKEALMPWLWACLWTVVAAAASLTPRLCADVLAYTQWQHLSLLQISSLVGPHGLGFLIVALNAALAQAWKALDEEKPHVATQKNLAFFLIAIFLTGAYGNWKLVQRDDFVSASAKQFHVEMLQPSIDQYQKWDENYASRIEGQFADLLSLPRLHHPDLILWPEAALAQSVEVGSDLGLASEWGAKLGVPQIVGVVSRANKRHYNSAVFLDTSGHFSGIYSKRELVPFGEYVPLPALRRYIGILSELGSMTAGNTHQELMTTVFGKTAVTICYEALFPRLARVDARRHARLLVNITNDGWYKDTWGPYQHYVSNIFRAIENRVTVMRCGNTGISAVIDPWGVAVAKTPLNWHGRLDASIPAEDYFPEGSFYSQFGEWFALLCAAGLLAAVFLRAKQPAPQ